MTSHHQERVGSDRSLVSRRQILKLGSLVAACSVSVVHSTFASDLKQCSARFSGEVVTKWLKDGRHMQLAEPFEYIGSDCRRWTVPKGAVTDGASIPQLFWTGLGGPFEDKYREASVIHDHYCELRNRKDVSVHNVFYDAMLTSGVDPTRAWIMHQAVLRFGPRWPDPAIDDPKCDVVDQNYDFTLCAQSASKPKLIWPRFNKALGKKFLVQIEKKAHQADLKKLRELVDALN